MEWRRERIFRKGRLNALIYRRWEEQVHQRVFHLFAGYTKNWIIPVDDIGPIDGYGAGSQTQICFHNAFRSLCLGILRYIASSIFTFASYLALLLPLLLPLIPQILLVSGTATPIIHLLYPAVIIIPMVSKPPAIRGSYSQAILSNFCFQKPFSIKRSTQKPSRYAIKLIGPRGLIIPGHMIYLQ